MTHPDDHLLDARLRDVPMPTGIAGRVAREVLFDDAAIDRLLVEIDLPAGLLDRTRRELAAMSDAATLALPATSGAARHGGSAGHGGGRHASPSRRARLWPAAMDLFADGGAVAAALSIVALMFFAGTELSRRLAPPAPGPMRASDRVATSPRLKPGPVTADGELARRESGTDAQPRQTPAEIEPGIVDGGRRSAAGGPQMPAVAATPETGVAEAAAPSFRPAERPRAAVEVRAAPAAAEAVGGGERGSRAGGIRTVILPAPVRHVPRVPGYDITFEMAHGESPFIDPARAAALAVDRPPLSLRTDSFDSLCEAAGRDQTRSPARRARRGGMPAVRVEEVLAALPAAPGVAGWSGPGLTLSVDAVRSLRPSPGSLLVEVCAAAPPVGGPAQAAAPLDAMLVLDRSAGPFAALSWQWLCRGLRHVVGQMGPADRLSLVVCGERPRLVALRADAATLASLLPELMREPTARYADFDAALRLVAAVGRREGNPARIVAAAHAESLNRCRAEGRDRLSEWQASQASAAVLPAGPKTEFVLIDPQQPLGAEGSPPVTAEGTTGRIAADPIAIGRAMLANVFGRPTLVATGCRLEVAFHPERVGSYRIVGHRLTASDALGAVDSRPIDLHAGEVVRVVYEVVPRPGQKAGSSAELVSATLAWTPADAGAGGLRQEQRVRRGLAGGSAAVADDSRSGLPSPHGCELLLAVALGQLSSASVHAEPWRQSAAEIATLVSRWRGRGDLTPMGGLLVDCLDSLGIVPDATGR